jgi:hypothetical protein
VADQREEVRKDYRQPTARERAILELLLSVERPGIEELRTQLPHVRVARWNCGCASFNVEVDRTLASPSQITNSLAVEAFSKQRDDPQKAFEYFSGSRTAGSPVSKSWTTWTVTVTSRPTRYRRLKTGKSRPCAHSFRLGQRSGMSLSDPSPASTMDADAHHL